MMNPAGGIARGAISGTNNEKEEAQYGNTKEGGEFGVDEDKDGGEYVCQCDCLMDLLNCKRCLVGGHVCAIGYSTSLRCDVPKECNFESICIPGHRELCTELKQGLNKIGRDWNITQDHCKLVDDLYHLLGNDLQCAEGVQR